MSFQESQRDAARTSSSVESQANVYLRDGSVITIKTVKMEKMNTITAVSRNFTYFNTKGLIS